MKIYIWIGILLFPILLVGQQKVTGKIFYRENQSIVPLENAEIYWENTQVFTYSSHEGSFEIPYSENYKNLIISYSGFQTDTLYIDRPQYLEHVLSKSIELQEVTLHTKKKDFQISHKGVNLSETLNKGELLKAACCNLSESFETNPSIDVSFTDAVTGIKQIQMLGLSSPYIQFNQENIPSIRGSNQLIGFNMVPGTWIESIQISKGSGSVINGFESISGQVNYEFIKLDKTNPFFLNLYANQNGRKEVNTHFTTSVNPHISTGIFVHGNLNSSKNDHNNDGFLDSPIGNQINLMNRWDYNAHSNNWHSNLILRYMSDERQAGQKAFDPDIARLDQPYWGSKTKIDRFENYFKLGKIFPDLPYKSFGFQAKFAYQNQNSYFGFTDYKIRQNEWYFNVIYQSIISNTYHKIKTGISSTIDDFDESLNETSFSRLDKTVGSFFEYNFDKGEKFSYIAGIRLDYHNHWGYFLSPRLHLKYNFHENTTLRASIGRGKRTANIFVENPQIFVSNRDIVLDGQSGNAYGLQPETAWNAGVNIVQNFFLWNHTGTVSAEFYHTFFEDQVVVDFENPREVQFYNLTGKSYANSFQISYNHQVVNNLELRFAYKNTFQKTDYRKGLLEKPLLARERYFLNLSYKTTLTEKGAQWHFDTTLNHVGKMRLPDTTSNPVVYQLADYSDGFYLMNAQINTYFNSKFSVYLGGENILNTIQKNPILSSDNPFGTYFDGSMVYAPIEGRMFYTGLRYYF